jgi:hypothetical protein
VPHSSVTGVLDMRQRSSLLGGSLGLDVPAAFAGGRSTLMLSLVSIGSGLSPDVAVNVQDHARSEGFNVDRELLHVRQLLPHRALALQRAHH